MYLGDPDHDKWQPEYKPAIQEQIIESIAVIEHNNEFLLKIGHPINGSTYL